MPVILREPRTMTQSELAEIVAAVREIVWGDPHWSEPAGSEKRSAMSLAAVANYLEGWGLNPDGQGEDDDEPETCDECGEVIPDSETDMLNASHGPACSLHPKNTASAAPRRPSFLGICWGCGHSYRSDRPENVCPECGNPAVEWS